jgi:type II secretory pathway component PulK
MNDLKYYSKGRESGVILLTVLWLVALISVLVIGALQEWRTELKLAANFQAKSQCRRLAEGGIYYALGKILAREIAVRDPEGLALNEKRVEKFWHPDGSSHILEIPGGRIKISISDEAGKFNLDTVVGESLQKILDIWGYPFDQRGKIIEAILNWRAGVKQLSDSFSSLPRKDFGANNNLSFDTVEEILWLQNCEGMNPERLSKNFTVQMVDGGMNLNTASPEVLKALGFTAAQVRQVLEARSVQPFRDFQDFIKIVDVTRMSDLESRVYFQSSEFFTIFSSGIVDYNKSKHTIKAIARLELDKPNFWSIIYWADDYPCDYEN